MATTEDDKKKSKNGGGPRTTAEEVGKNDALEGKTCKPVSYFSTAREVGMRRYLDLSALRGTSKCAS